jgi:type IV pilus assembly protein PilE
MHRPSSCSASLATPRRVARGFTLIEVMITVAIVGILASVALPAYSDYVRRGQLPEAFNALSDYRAKMEQYYQDNRNYGSSPACADATGTGNWSSFASTEHFRYGCVATASPQGYTITATGRTGPAVGHVFTINHNGDRATTTFKGSDVTASCWLTRDRSC